MDLENIKILIVDDDSSVLEVLEDFVREKGFTPLLAENSNVGLRLVKEHHKDIAFIVSDYMMEPSNGLEFRKFLLDGKYNIPFGLISGYISRDLAINAIELKVCGFLQKPFSKDQVLGLIERESKTRVMDIQEQRMIKKTFIEESVGILEELEPLILSLEDDSENYETFNAIFRLVHTVKGASGILDDPNIKDYLHNFEDLLVKIKSGEQQVTENIVSILLFAFDNLQKMISALEKGEAIGLDIAALIKVFQTKKLDGAPKEKTHPTDEGVNLGKSDKKTNASNKEKISVEPKLLDEFMEQSGEITVIRNMINKLIFNIQKSLPGDQNVNHLTELLEELHKINSTMQSKVLELRKIPISKVLRTSPRTVRDVSKKLGKKVNLNIEGESVKVDHSIGQVLSDCLIHVLRNAMDHGIENPGEREDKGKDPTGKLIISCSEEADEIVLQIKDDGKGIDPGRLRAKAESSEKYSREELAEMTDNDFQMMIFEPGLSTAEEITDISGRGVGMDMVRNSIESIGGRIELDSVLDRGTTFRFIFPVQKSVLIIHSLVVKACDQVFAISQDNVVRLMRLEENSVYQIKEIEGSRLLVYGDSLIPIMKLNEILGLKPTFTSDSKCALDLILTQTKEGKQVVLEVDKILDGEDVVVKRLDPILTKFGVYSGATFMGDGKVALILDIEEIAQKANSKIQEDNVETTEEAGLVNNVGFGKTYIIFELDVVGRFAIELDKIYRLEEAHPSNIKIIHSMKTFVYRSKLTRIYDLSLLPGIGKQIPKPTKTDEKTPLLMMQNKGVFQAIQVREIIDIRWVDVKVDTSVRSHQLIAGTITCLEGLVNVLDIERVASFFEKDKNQAA